MVPSARTVLEVADLLVIVVSPFSPCLSTARASKHQLTDMTYGLR